MTYKKIPAIKNILTSFYFLQRRDAVKNRKNRGIKISFIEIGKNILLQMQYFLPSFPATYHSVYIFLIQVEHVHILGYTYW